MRCAGPIDYLVLEFPEQRPGGTLRAVLDLVEAGTIRLLDLRVVRRRYDGTVEIVTLADLDGADPRDVVEFDGVESGLVDHDDLGEVARVVEPGSAAGLLVYENTWAAPLADAAFDSGTRIVASGRIPATSVTRALDRLDAAS